MTDKERERAQTEHTRRNYQGLGKSPRAWGAVVEAAGEMEGWECNDCGKLISGERIYYHGEGSPENPRPESRRECCPYCGSEDVSPVGLVENEQRFESGGDVNQQWKKAMSLERAIAAGIRDALADLQVEADEQSVEDFFADCVFYVGFATRFMDDLWSGWEPGGDYDLDAVGRGIDDFTDEMESLTGIEFVWDEPGEVEMGAVDAMRDLSLDETLKAIEAYHNTDVGKHEPDGVFVSYKCGDDEYWTEALSAIEQRDKASDILGVLEVHKNMREDEEIEPEAHRSVAYMSDAVDKFLNDEDGYAVFLDEAGATAMGKQSFGDAWMNVSRVAGEFLGPAELEELEAMLNEEVENIQEEEGIDLFEDED